MLRLEVKSEEKEKNNAANLEMCAISRIAAQ
jgi:hypothetical protein